jgi:hypothetical protein
MAGKRCRFSFGACPCRRTGCHFAGTCAGLDCYSHITLPRPPRAAVPYRAESWRTCKCSRSSAANSPQQSILRYCGLWLLMQSSNTVKHCVAATSVNWLVWNSAFTCRTVRTRCDGNRIAGLLNAAGQDFRNSVIPDGDRLFDRHCQLGDAGASGFLGERGYFTSARKRRELNSR